MSRTKAYWHDQLDRLCQEYVDQLICGEEFCKRMVEMGHDRETAESWRDAIDEERT